MATETEIYRYAAYFFFFLLAGPAAIVAIFNILFFIKMQLEDLEKRIKEERDDTERLYFESAAWMKTRN